MTPSANDTSQLSPHVGRCTALNQDQLGHYLAGLMEGDGYFGPHKLEIAYHGKDKSAAYGLRSCLGYGQVYPYSRNRHAVRFVIRNRAGRTHVLNLVNGKLVHDAKVDQLKRNGYDQLIPVLPALKKVTLSNHWLAGFLDSDGSLGIAIAPSKTHKTGRSVRLEVKLSQRDPYLLQALAKLFDVSKIYQCKTKVDFKLKITGLARLKKMFVYLDEFKLRSKKYVQYLLLRKAYLAMVQKNHRRPDGLRRMAALKARVQNVYKLRRPWGSSETTRSTPAVPNSG
jgi:hypothetical protein